MNKTLISTTVNTFKIILIAMIIFAIYKEIGELTKLQKTNQHLKQEITEKETHLQKLQNIIILYSNKDFIYPYLVRKYGLIDKKEAKLYIMEVQN